MDSSEKKAAQDIAFNIALAEMVRLLISEYCHDLDKNAFRRKIVAFEQAAVNGLNSRNPLVGLDAQTNQFIQDTATGYVSRLVSSIIHPDDAPTGRD